MGALKYETLKNRVRLFRHAYHAHDVSIIPDDQLDFLKHKLKKMEELNGVSEDSPSSVIESSMCDDGEECKLLKQARRL